MVRRRGRRRRLRDCWLGAGDGGKVGLEELILVIVFFFVWRSWQGNGEDSGLGVDHDQRASTLTANTSRRLFCRRSK